MVINRAIEEHYIVIVIIIIIVIILECIRLSIIVQPSPVAKGALDVELPPLK